MAKRKHDAEGGRPTAAPAPGLYGAPPTEAAGPEPEAWAFGVKPSGHPGRWLAFGLSTSGNERTLTPKRAGEDMGESKAAAVARARAAFAQDVLLPKPRRVA